MPNEEYKSICDTCYKKTWYEKEQQCHSEYPKQRHCATCGHTEEVEPLKMIRCQGTLRLIDNSLLDDRFTRYYNNGQRIEVEYKDKTKERLYIGKSTGFKPIWLAIKKANSTGGEVLWCSHVISIKSLNKYK